MVIFFLVGLSCVCTCENPQYIGANCLVFKDRQTMQLLGETYINHTANISSVKHCKYSETGWIIFKQKLPNNSWIGFPSLLCSDLPEGSFAVSVMGTATRSVSRLQGPGCLLPRTFIVTTSDVTSWQMPLGRWWQVSAPDVQTHCVYWGGSLSDWITKCL